MAERAHPEDPGFQGDSIYKKKLMERYEWCNQFIKDKDILDIPCGCGWGTSQLQGYNSCIGMDVDEKSINFANTNYKKHGLSFECKNMKSFCYLEEMFEVIICLEGYEHVSMSTGILFLEQVEKALYPGGLLLMTCPVLSPEGKHSGNPYHKYEPNETDLMMIVSSRFRVLNIEREEFPDNPIYRMVLQRR